MKRNYLLSVSILLAGIVDESKAGCAKVLEMTKSPLIVLADMGNEPDEEQQIVHMLMCSNEFELEGLIAVTGKYLQKNPRPDLFPKLIDGYAQVRLLVRGVTCVQFYHRGWDHPSNIEVDLPDAALATDRAGATLVTDLKQRGLLEDTLIIWWGEFGRAPMAQGSGRDHHINAFSLWLAVGGIQPGISYGSTDELGYNSVVDIVNVRDLHATMLHCFGVDHQRFTERLQGLDIRLTGVEPSRVLHDILT